MWVWAQVPLGGPPPPPPCALGYLPPPHQPGPPPPGALQKEPRGVGGRGKERAGREGVWLEGRVLQLQWGMGGTLQTLVGARPTSGGFQSKVVFFQGKETHPPKKHPPQYQDAPKGRQQKGETGPGTQIFADFCRISLIFGSLCKSRDLGVADLRRKPQETANFRRKPQKTADFCRNRFLPFAVSLLARSYNKLN